MTERYASVGSKFDLVVEFLDHRGEQLRVRCQATVLRVEEHATAYGIALAVRWHTS